MLLLLWDEEVSWGYGYSIRAARECNKKNAACGFAFAWPSVANFV